jgi:hypothetical protein
MFSGHNSDKIVLCGHNFLPYSPLLLYGGRRKLDFCYTSQAEHLSGGLDNPHIIMVSDVLSTQNLFLGEYIYIGLYILADLLRRFPLPDMKNGKKN